MVVNWVMWIFWGFSFFLILWMIKLLQKDSTVCRTEAAKRRRMPVVSLDLKGTLVNPVDLSLRQSELPHFLHLCRISTLHTITQVADDREESALLATLKDCGAFKAGLKPHRVMFCDSLPGAVSMTRQLQPLIHIEDDEWVTEQLRNKVANVYRASEGLKGCVETVDAVDC